MKVLLVVVDNESTTHWAPLGAMYVHEMLSGAGHIVSRWHQDVWHYRPEELGRASRLADVVAMGWIGGYQQHRMAMALAAAVDPAVPLVVGGHAPSADPSWYRANLRERGDVEVVEGYGRSEILDCAFDADPDAVRIGLWRWPYDYYATVRAPRCLPTDRVFPILSGRGCPYHCSFCYRMADGYRYREVRRIADEIRSLHRDYGTSYFQFQDELLMTSPGRAVEIAEAIEALHLPIRWSCQGRVNVAHRDLSILPRMAKAGCVFVNYGIESTDALVLDLIGKKQTVEQSHAVVAATLAAGMSPGLNLLWNLPGDSLASLAGNVAFIERYTDDAQLRTIHTVQPYPGSDLYHQCVRDGVFRHAGDFYAMHTNSDLATVSFIPGMTPRDVDRAIGDANARLLSAYADRRKADILGQAHRLYIDGDAAFRGWRQV